VLLAKSSVPSVTEDKSVVPTTPFKTPVPPPVAGKDTSGKSDKKLVELLLYSVLVLNTYISDLTVSFSNISAKLLMSYDSLFTS